MIAAPNTETAPRAAAEAQDRADIEDFLALAKAGERGVTGYNC